MDAMSERKPRLVVTPIGEYTPLGPGTYPSRVRKFRQFVQKRAVAPPASVFKYRTVAQAAEILETRKLWFSATSTLNDPVDAHWHPLWQLNTAAFHAKAAAEMRELLVGRLDWSRFKDRRLRELASRDRVRLSNLTSDARDTEVARLCKTFSDWKLDEDGDRIGSLMRRARLCCFSSNPSNGGMWSHYASGHAGVVLEFDSAALETAWSLPLCPVEYRDDLPKMIDEGQWLESLIFGGPTIDLDQETVNRWMLVKANAWVHECEVRAFFHLVTEDGDTARKVEFPETALRSITLGCRTSSEDRTMIERLAIRTNPSIEVWNCVRSETSLSIDRKRVELDVRAT